MNGPAAAADRAEPVGHGRAAETRWLGRIGFEAALAEQESTVQQVRAGHCGPQFLLLEHEPVFTIGRTRDRSSLRDVGDLPYPLVEINRGGKATYHGPGQLVGYLVLNLREFRPDLHHYLRFLEELVIDVVGGCGVAAGRRDGLTGVWVGERKIASIGVGVRQWVTMHGFALNVSGPLDGFGSITPCGIDGVVMTSIEREGGDPVTVREVARIAESYLPVALQRFAAP